MDLRLWRVHCLLLSRVLPRRLIGNQLVYLNCHPIIVYLTPPASSKVAQQPMEGNNPKRGETSAQQPSPLQIDPKWYARPIHRATCITDRQMISFQDALRTFFQPLRTDDPRLNFYTVYKREATEYDVDYVKKYDEDLNTTLIFVRSSFCTVFNKLDRSCSRVFSLQSARLSSSMFTPSFNPILTTNPQPFFVRSSSPSTNLQSQTNPPLFRLSKRTLLMKSSPLLHSCTQVS